MEFSHMENMGLQHLSLFLEEEIFVLKEEISQLAHTPEPIFTEEEEVEALLESDAAQAEEILYEGGFEKGILIVFQDNELSDAYKELLFKILQAVNCNLKDIALVSAPSLEKTDEGAVSALSPNKIIVFGKTSHSIMGHKKATYEIIQEDGVEYLFADDLQEISQEVGLKKALWNQLQILFGIKK